MRANDAPARATVALNGATHAVTWLRHEDQGAEFAELSIGEKRLSARLEGYRGEPPHLVKGVTYHRLALEPTGTGWRATVVLDV